MYIDMYFGKMLFSAALKHKRCWTWRPIKIRNITEISEFSSINLFGYIQFQYVTDTHPKCKQFQIFSSYNVGYPHSTQQ